MQLLDGKLASQALKDELSKTIDKNNPPHLAAILVGSNGASQTYVASKVKNCKEVGFESSLIELDENVSEEILLKTISDLNNNKNIDLKNLAAELLISQRSILKEYVLSKM